MFLLGNLTLVMEHILAIKHLKFKVSPVNFLERKHTHIKGRKLPNYILAALQLVAKLLQQKLDLDWKELFHFMVLFISYVKFSHFYRFMAKLVSRMEPLQNPSSHLLLNHLNI